MTELGADLERIVPDHLDPTDEIDRTTLELHVARYRWAARFASNRAVLDLACGVGYGSALLADNGAKSVLGVDLDVRAIAYATERYSRPSLRFESGDALQFAPPGRFGLVVSLETIEHVADPARLVQHLARFVEDDGWFVGSVPVTVSTDINRFHRQDFNEQSFRELIACAGFSVQEELLQVQPFSLRSVLGRRQAGCRRALVSPRNLLVHYLRFPRALLRRARETVRYGFCNRYLVVAARKSGVR